MRLLFLTPWGALIGLLGLVPLTALLLVRRRARRVRRSLALPEPPARRLLAPLAGLVVFAALLALAAAQPVIERTRTVRVRTDAEAFVVLDVSRSMLARRARGGPMRIDRAKAVAADLRSALVEVPFGIASITDRVLPHLFPSADERVFQATLAASVGIERPPPRSSLAASATELESLGTIRTQRYFAPSARRRLLVVLTDGETQPVARARLRSIFRRPPVIDVVFVRFWNADERVYSRGSAEPYEPDPSSAAVLAGIAEALSGSVFSEREAEAAGRKARELIGNGPTLVRGERGRRIALAPYLLAAALAPLILLLVKRDR